MIRSTSPKQRASHWVGLTVFLLVAPGEADDWPQWRGIDRSGTWRETGLIEEFAGQELPRKWVASIGPGYSGPTVAAGRVYITDRLTKPEQVERVHCFEEQTGNTVWSHTYACPYRNVSYEAGPRAAVTVGGGRAFALGTMGHLHVFDAATGEVLWSSDLGERFQIEMPIWGIAAAPLLHGELVILQIGGADGACLVALAQNDGREIWRALDDRASYAAPILIEQAGEEVLVCWTGDHIAGLNPRTGSVHWKSPMSPVKMVIGIATPVLAEDRLFVTSFYDGSKMLRLHRDRLAAEEIWRERGESELNTRALHSIIATPLMIGDHVYGVDSYGELRCLDAETGDRIWEDQTATPRARWSNIHMVRNGDRVWMFNERGELIIAQLSPAGFRELSRTHLIAPTRAQLKRKDGGVCWAHPAFANRHVFARNDEELVCASLAADNR